MSRLESLYQQLPDWLQDLAVTAQGALYYRQRFGGAFRDEYNLLAAIERASPLQLELLQVARLRRMLAHAAATVPYYQARIQPGHWEKIRAGDWSAFYDLPITEKSSLRSDVGSFLSGGKVHSGWIRWNTSGTTGSPLQLYYSPEAVSRQYAYVERYREQAGVNRFVRRAQFTGKLIVAGERPKRYWRFDWANRALLMSTVHLDTRTLPAYLQALERFKPGYLTGYPSAITLLAQQAIRSGFRLRIPAVLTSAETLLPEQRDLIEAAFGAKVYDQYGQTEMQSFWFECRYRRMHTHPLFGVTEILRPDGSACSAGETGEVVLTGLINSAMPLIRYRIGDRAAWSSDDRCPCGRTMPMIESIDGRKEDYLYSAQRGWVGRMDPALKGVAGIIECQFVQESVGRITVLCVPDASFGDSARQQLEQNLRQRLGTDIQIEFELVARIPRGANGKFRAVVSRLGGIEANPLSVRLERAP
jgi:phenylacetate-CoA ligase